MVYYDITANICFYLDNIVAHGSPPLDKLTFSTEIWVLRNYQQILVNSTSQSYDLNSGTGSIADQVFTDVRDRHLS